MFKYFVIIIGMFRSNDKMDNRDRKAQTRLINSQPLMKFTMKNASHIDYFPILPNSKLTCKLSIFSKNIG